MNQSLMDEKDTRVQRDTWNPVGICEDHLARLNTPQRPIVNKYREGKVKSTPARGVKETLKPCAYKPLEPLPAREGDSVPFVARLSRFRGVAEAKASLNRASSGRT